MQDKLHEKHSQAEKECMFVNDRVGVFILQQELLIVL